MVTATAQHHEHGIQYNEKATYEGLVLGKGSQNGLRTRTDGKKHQKDYPI